MLGSKLVSDVEILRATQGDVDLGSKLVNDVEIIRATQGDVDLSTICKF